MSWATKALLLAAGLIALLGGACSSQEPALSGDVAIAFHFSQFTPTTVTVPAGVPVSFLLRNDDPIEHEWIVGARDVHERHRLGTEPFHDEVPTEVTVPALSTRMTTITFEKPGEYAFICHLPGHEAYGMRGIVRVLAARTAGAGAS